MEKLLEEDEIINKNNKYHDSFKDVDIRSNIAENVVVFLVLLVPIIIMFFLFRIHNKHDCTDKNIQVSNVMFALMLVSLLLTVSEALYIYGFNVENNYNQLSKVINKNIGFKEYLDIKQINQQMPNIVLNDGKISYENNMQSTTFLMFVPILLICIFMLTSLTGCLSLTFKEMIGIFINFLILLSIFSLTFVNLGISQSDPVDYAKIANKFDPFDEVHRFQTNYSFMDNKITIILFLSLIVFIGLFVSLISIKK